MLPTPVLLHDRIRVFCTGCDENLRGRVFFADLEAEPPFQVMHVETEPVLDLGPPGSFDADGVNPSCVVNRHGVLHLYYIGWQRLSLDRPYALVAGLAASDDSGLSFRRVKAPLLELGGSETLFRTAPFVWLEGECWRMLYIGGGEFFDGPDEKRLPIYSMREMTSPDGLAWPAQGQEVLAPCRENDEIGFGRPVLLRIARQELDVRRLLFSIRTTNGYRLVERPWPLASGADNAPTDVLRRGSENWDQEMTCFGAHLRLPAEDLLLYNGNRFGRTGFGLAVRNPS